ncbi:MAG: ATP phosphoribosyltransferase regulatory subunit [Gammaproteobacteria bacterium]|nr:ATP phosphoribosyltransferase regulatory subunit [Gammaproteobacteria bacterium]
MAATATDHWLLPEGIEELLPSQAQKIEELRRAVLDTFRTWGYDFVVPPLVEHLESLLVGNGTDLDHSTFKLIDQLTGRMLGVRADITPQVARIDAHRLKRDEPVRLCYAGPVLLTRARELGGSRAPYQAGVELYGHGGLESDLEILTVMLESLGLAGLDTPYLDIGHVGIYRSLARQARLTLEQENAWFDAIQRKSRPDIDNLTHELEDASVGEMLRALIDLNGDIHVLEQARKVLARADDGVRGALDQLSAIAQVLAAQAPNVTLHFDLAELRGYRYHTGAVFAAYVPGYGQAVAQGGRYDHIGSVFGRARKATGFSMDLRAITTLKPYQRRAPCGIFAPAIKDATLAVRVRELRAAGERVIVELPGQVGGPASMGCDRQLVQDSNGWTVAQLG